MGPGVAEFGSGLNGLVDAAVGPSRRVAMGIGLEPLRSQIGRWEESDGVVEIPFSRLREGAGGAE